MDNLPEEILLRIFGDKSLENGQNLPNLALVNRKFDRIARPLLYYECQLRDRSQPIRCMLNTLVTNDGTRQLVQCLEVGLWEPQDAQDATVTAISVNQLSDIVRSVEFLDSCPPDYQRQFGIDLLNCKRDAMIAAILSLLPNLNSLTISRSPRCRSGDFVTGKPRMKFSHLDLTLALTMQLIELFSTPSLAESGLFKHLSYLCICDIKEEGDDYPGWDSCLISVFLKLPALKTFIGYGCRGINSNRTWICDEGASVATKVHLSHCQLGANTIRRILRSCQALEEFHCRRVCETCLDDESTCDYSYADIHHDLFRHRKSLSRLNLSNSGCPNSNLRMREPITTLVELENLKFLWADADLLFGRYDEYDEDLRSLSEILPTNLRHINIDGDDAGTQLGVFAAIRRLLLSSANLESAMFLVAYVPDAEEILEELSGVSIKVLGHRPSHGYCTFRMDRAESNQAEVPPANAG